MERYEVIAQYVRCHTAMMSSVFISVMLGLADLGQVTNLHFGLGWLFHCTFPCQRSEYNGMQHSILVPVDQCPACF